MKWETESLRAYCAEVCSKANVTLNIPIVVNTRLTKTLGKLICTQSGNHLSAIRIEFSRQFLNSSNEESAKNIIKHECAHYIVVERTHENHGHDQYFKQVCAEIGCQEDKAAVQPDYASDIKMKYDVFCPKCGKVASYSRMCKVLKNISHYMCPKCDGPINYVQNW